MIFCVWCKTVYSSVIIGLINDTEVIFNIIENIYIKSKEGKQVYSWIHISDIYIIILSCI